MYFLQFLPFLLLVVLANYAERHNTARYVLYGILVLIDGAALLGSVLFAFVGLGAPQLRAQGYQFPEGDFYGLALLLLLVGLLGFLILLPAVRRWLSRLMPINPSSPLHATALSLAIYYVGASIAPLLLVGGLAGLAQLTVGATIWDLVQSGLALALLGILGVGFLIRRNGSETLRRLGFRGLTWRQLGITLGAVVAFLALDYGVSWAWHALDPQQYDLIGRISSQLFGPITIWKAIAIGVSAGVGEETLFRGAVLPRFGTWITAALFAAGHTQYGFSPATLEVFVIGVVLALIRYRIGTTSCVIIHATYNFADVLLSFLFP